MSQNSLVLPTSGTLSGLAAIQAVNAALDTLNTLASAASAPSSPEAGQLWHDTGNNLLKIRSTDNTAWITVGALDEVNHVFNAAVKAQPNIFGLLLSNDAGSAATVLDIAAGGANDSTGTVYMRLAATTKKNVTAAWASGSGNGSLDTGTLQASKFYHVHLILNPTTGASDILTSLSYSNPAMPSGFTNFVPIGAIYSNASSNVAAFVQNGNEFIYVNGSQDVGGNVTPSSPSLVSLRVPGGCKVNVLFRGELYNGATGNTIALLFYSPDEASQTPTINAASGAQNASLVAVAAQSGNNGYASAEYSIRTNTSGQIYVSANNTASASFVYGIWTKGFVYPRGLQ